MRPKIKRKTVTVTRKREKETIEDREAFGWNLRKREDIALPAQADPDATPSVKLHFARRLDLPNLDKIKDLESQYPFDELPEEYVVGCLPAIFAKAFGWGGPLLILIGIVLLIAGPVSIAVPITIGILVLGVILGFVGISWERSISKKEDEAFKRRREIIIKRQKIKKKLEALKS